MVIKIPRWARGSGALSLSFDRKTATTRAFLNWIPNHEHEALLNLLRDQKDKSAYRHPLLLPTHMLNSHQRTMEAYRKLVDDTIVKVELRVGYALPGLLYYKPIVPLVAWGTAGPDDFEDVVRRLHGTLAELGALCFECTFGKDAGAFLMKTQQELAGRGFISLVKVSPRVSEGFVHQIDFAANLYSTMVGQAAVLKERVQSHINLVSETILQRFR